MVIRVLGQGEPLGTRSCVTVGNEGRASGLDVFEFGDREDVCGEEKRQGRSLELVSFLGAHSSPSSAALSGKGNFRASFVQRSGDNMK